jgi:hypothetical protein
MDRAWQTIKSDLLRVLDQLHPESLIGIFIFDQSMKRLPEDCCYTIAEVKSRVVEFLNGLDEPNALKGAESTGETTQPFFYGEPFRESFEYVNRCLGLGHLKTLIYVYSRTIRYAEQDSLEDIKYAGTVLWFMNYQQSSIYLFGTNTSEDQEERDIVTVQPH